MRPHHFVTIAIFVVILSACTAYKPILSLLQTPTPTIDITQIYKHAELTITWSMPTRTPTITMTPVPSLTPTPKATATPAPTEKPKVISKENIKELNITYQIGASRVMDLAFSPNGSRLLVLTATHLELYDAADGKRLWQKISDMMYTKVNFSPDGKKIIASTNGGGLQEWNASNGEMESNIFDIQSQVNLHVLSNSNNRLLLNDYAGKTTLYDTQTLESVADLSRKDINYVLREAIMTSTGDRVLLIGDHGPSDPLAMMYTNEKWDFYSLAGITGREFGYTFSTDDSWIASISTQSAGGDLLNSTILTIWPANDKKIYLRTTVKGTARQMVLSPDGKYVYMLMNTNNRIAVIDVEKAHTVYLTDQKVNTFTVFEPEWIEGSKYDPNFLTISSDGKQLASCDISGVIKIWDSEPRQVKTTIDLKTAYAPIYSRSLGLNTRTNLFVRSAIYPTAIELVNRETGEIVKTFGANKDYIYTSISLSPDASLISAAGIPVGEAYRGNPYQNLIIWDVTSGDQIFNLPSTHGRLVTHTRISPNNKTLASISRGQLITWDIKKAKMNASMGGYSTCEFSADSQHILYDNIDYGVYISDVDDGKMVSVQYAEDIMALAFAPDELSIAVGAWNLSKNQESMVFYMDTQPPYKRKPQVVNHLRSGVRFLAYSPDGNILATLDMYGTLYLNDTQSGAELVKFDNLVVPEGLTFNQDGTAILIGSTDGSLMVIETTPQRKVFDNLTS